MPLTPRVFSRRQLVRSAAKLATVTTVGAALPSLQLFAAPGPPAAPAFEVLQYGAVGDGKTLDTTAIQKAIDAAATSGTAARVLVNRGHKYLVGTIELKSNMDFHLEGDAELLVSSVKADYSGGAAVIANGANGLTISGTGRINGRALEFMTHFEEANEWWIPKEWRPRLFILTGCTNLVVRDITIASAPSWSLHMLGCEKVLVEKIRIHNNLDVPNCDGIDPDHCRDVVIRGCHIICGDDAIVIKTTRQQQNYGPSANITVSDCLLETQDSGLKIGTETTADIYNIVFERCKIVTSCRGLTIQLRDEGNVYKVRFRDIEFVSRYHSDPWWGRGEAISLTAIPRTPETKVGTISDVSFANIKGRAENSIRINGTKESRIHNIRMNHVDVTFDRWTKYRGNLFDNRPTTAYPAIEPHNTPGFYIRFADDISLQNCRVRWGKNVPEYFSNALQAHDVTRITMKAFKGEAAFPKRDKAVLIT
ncbi:glycoside hydrolase [Segetibacter sp. 3557_3]|uniref:glycoside hydrolase family 28 protein n=1 Tax=Segetibacter sp. 3557_3 TaxID=2547429 RepID=UPI001058B274|nr:glycosyl hydrolase family 28 protein [Segetibacter sp. 3557_3]TDH24213.1 glycoside hydrolase [Segetibacter sp. 3557_3]